VRTARSFRRLWRATFGPSLAERAHSSDAEIREAAFREICEKRREQLERGMTPEEIEAAHREARRSARWKTALSHRQFNAQLKGIPRHWWSRRWPYSYIRRPSGVVVTGFPRPARTPCGRNPRSRRVTRARARSPGRPEPSEPAKPDHRHPKGVVV
jgi:hypothetical protein